MKETDSWIESMKANPKKSDVIMFAQFPLKESTETANSVRLLAYNIDDLHVRIISSSEIHLRTRTECEEVKSEKKSRQ